MREQVTEDMKRVYLESPYKGKNWENTKENLHFGRLCMHDCLVNRNEAPFPSHLLYTQPGVLDDKIEAERELGGFKAGPAFKKVCDSSVFYINRGISGGMYRGARISIAMKQEFEYRVLPGYPNNFPRPTICTITGSSGVGKSTIVRKLFSKRSYLRLVKSFTTRMPRESDLFGEYECNVPRENFEANKNWLLWVVEAHGNLYGTRRDSIEEMFTPPIFGNPSPKFMILTPSAVERLRQYVSTLVKDPEDRVASFYILSPREKELKRRLVARGEDKVSIRKRIKDCRKWDDEALASGLPYIFLPSIDCDPEPSERAAAQISLFF
jgi:guanylate kinase